VDRIMERRGRRPGQISGPGHAHTRSDSLDAPHYAGLICPHVWVPHTIHEYMRGGQGGSYHGQQRESSRSDLTSFQLSSVEKISLLGL
jgi:hypothetical protein